MIAIIRKNRISFLIGVISVIIVLTFILKAILFITQLPNKKTQVIDKGDITAVSPNTQRKIDIYIIKEGDELWHIAQEKYGDADLWTKIARDNNLTNPNIIHSGNTLKIIY
ncbi:MAG: LysM peptidoglycan-binding domain-containing protein [Candidatus Roizmanbacteria bacterium]|nr:MAG: LysM peptidoglycan-binding domain-containing protein [Candidatus Roizmanbacteria bacterium]